MKPAPAPSFDPRRAAVVLGAYLFAAWIGLHLDLIARNVSPVWPPTGVAIAAVLLFGRRYAAIVVLGAFAANAAKGVGLPVALAIAIGNAIEALVTAGIFRRYFPRSRRPESIAAIVTFVVAAAIGAMTAATIGTAALLAAGLLKNSFGLVWITWWSGDTLGAVLVGTLLLVWSRRPFLPTSLPRRVEFFVMLALTGVCGWLIFFRATPFPSSASDLPVTFLAFPAVAWATMRFGQRGATAAALLLWVLAVRGTDIGMGPFAQLQLNNSLLFTQAFIAVVGITGLIVGGEFARRRRIERTLATSEERYRSLLAQAPEAICVADTRTGKFIEVNEAAQRLFGMSRETLLSVGPGEVSAAIQPGGTPLDVALRAVIDGALGGETQDFEWTHVRGDGTPVPCDIRLMRVPGRAPLIRATITDRTDRPTFAQVTILESLARGASLDTVLARLISLLEAQLHGGCGAIYRWNETSRRFAVISAPALPPDFAQANLELDASPSMPFVRRARAGIPQATASIFDDADWDGLRPMGKRFGFRAVWSWPISGSDGSILGNLVMHFAAARLPTPAQRALMGVAGSLAALAIQRDVSASSLRRAEEQLREAQKMDAVGRLAGGIAHDFNNLLTVIASASTLLEDRVPQDAEAREELAMIQGATDQAAGLTRQLLAFSRRQPWETRALDLNQAIRRLEPMLLRLVGPSIRLQYDLDDDVGRIRADEIQIQQVLINLVVNARDAMPAGGVVRLHTQTVVADAGEGSASVRLDVEDEGSGIPAGMEDQIFEPFFTTKSPGQGTGLGLATVYGIVRQAGGTIQAMNRPSGGALVRITLPTVPAEVTAAAPIRTARRGAEEGQRLLLVEDEATLRRLVARMLRAAGYVVHEADSVAQALAVLAQEPPFALVITDVVMPGASGRELGEAIEAEGGPPVLYTSGYTEDTIFLRKIHERGLPFLTKPFTVDDLLTVVRRLIPDHA